MLNNPTFILVRPQMGENIGAAARAMANFGLSDLRIVAPRDGWPNEAAVAMASGALDGYVKVTVFDTLQAASGDLNYMFATTARSRDVAKPVFTPAAAVENSYTNKDRRTGFVFGPERTGLENDEVALCQAILTVPTAPDFASLNLAQGVLLIAYQWHAAGDATPGKQPAHEIPAPQAKTEELVMRLFAELEAGKFFKTDDVKATMMRNIRAMILRGEWSEQEVRTFQGIITALTKNPN